MKMAGGNPVGRACQSIDTLAHINTHQNHWHVGGFQLNETFSCDGNRMCLRRTQRCIPANSASAGYTEQHNLVETPSDSVLPRSRSINYPPPYTSVVTTAGRRLPPPSYPPPPPPDLHSIPTSRCDPPPLPHRSRSPSRRLACNRRNSTFRHFHRRGRNRLNGRMGTFTAPAASETEEPKHCCGVMVTQTVSIRWFIVMIAFVGLCCAIVGTVLGALKATGREHLTVSLLMIGVGIVLITVSGAAWKLTSHDAPSCRMMFGIQSENPEPNRRFVPRIRPNGRPQHPYGAMMYPEFQYRPPPPSYQASMQEYRLRLLLLDRPSGVNSSALSPISPQPPTYRSYPVSTLQRCVFFPRIPHHFLEQEYSQPPSYRSRASSAQIYSDMLEPRHLATHRENGNGGAPSHHSQADSCNRSFTLSFLSHESLFPDTSRPRPLHPPQANQPVTFTSPSEESRNSVIGELTDDSPVAPALPPRMSRSLRVRNEQSLRGAWKNSGANSAGTNVQNSSSIVNHGAVIVSLNEPNTNHTMVPSGDNFGGLCEIPERSLV
ncbi:uncharacterized protein LOC143237127 isoform X1 [Tachypleus tridentatus]|uniref:uncharacterized protein LOC143237127 isoform X1 n=1 Tax=Tachypleus tridentatus TaxID=6853 RepID=UPI003FD48612